MTDPPTLFPLGLLEPIDASSQVDRIPGVDAVCEAGKDECEYPFCCCHREKEKAA
jgi:hypothetical protein